MYYDDLMLEKVKLQRQDSDNGKKVNINCEWYASVFTAAPKAQENRYSALLTVNTLEIRTSNVLWAQIDNLYV